MLQFLVEIGYLGLYSFQTYEYYEKSNIGVLDKLTEREHGMIKSAAYFRNCSYFVPGINLSQFFHQINPSDLGITPLNGDQFDK